ncbi:hypothetical protein ACFOZ7_20675 [Natribaculum luteum]|uniref:Uncharacterized protein n=1 Tax=Natribaculum luteum TaxID=1586232 RepID=A0ABD5P595_9EURY|nr:hypothetical protein [Natribaculum luteum]
MSSRNALVVGFLVAVAAGVVAVLSRYSTTIGFEYFGLETTAELSALAIGTNLLTLLVEPLGVFVVGVVAVRWLGESGSYAAFAVVLFLGAAIGSAVCQFALRGLLDAASEPLGRLALGYLEVTVGTGLRVAVAGLAGVGARYAFTDDLPPARRTRAD